MCVGVPMQVVEAREGVAICAVDGERREVSTLLITDGPIAAGDWLLCHLGNAFRRLDEEEAGLIRDALGAVMAAADGQPFEHLIADLVDREPELPPHLRPAH